jgi:hypothetical protein
MVSGCFTAHQYIRLLGPVWMQLMCVCNMYTEAVRLNRRTKSATDDDIKSEVQWYLHGAADRCGGKTERAKKAKQRKANEADA